MQQKTAGARRDNGGSSESDASPSTATPVSSRALSLSPEVEQAMIAEQVEAKVREVLKEQAPSDSSVNNAASNDVGANIETKD